MSNIFSTRGRIGASPPKSKGGEARAVFSAARALLLHHRHLRVTFVIRQRLQRNRHFFVNHFRVEGVQYRTAGRVAHFHSNVVLIRHRTATSSSALSSTSIAASREALVHGKV